MDKIIKVMLYDAVNGGDALGRFQLRKQTLHHSPGGDTTGIQMQNPFMDFHCSLIRELIFQSHLGKVKIFGKKTIFIGGIYKVIGKIIFIFREI